MPLETISQEDLISFLSQRDLFLDMEPEDLAKVAERCHEFSLEAHQDLFKFGDRGTTFFMIYKGRVRIWRKEEGKEIDLAVFETGDKFGEEAPIFNRPRSASVTTLVPSKFITLERDDLNWLLRTYPETKLRLEAIAKSHEIARQQKFHWLHDGEVIHLVARRDIFQLWVELIKPALAIILALFLLAVGFLRIPGVTLVSAILGGMLMGAGILWAIWEVLDWRNDFFMITNQRVVWLERIILQSDSRREAPLSAIQSVNVERSYWGRVLDFGNVFVRTFTGMGSLMLTNVHNPDQFKDAIEEQLLRVRSKVESQKSDAMRYSIRKTLGMDTPETEIDFAEIIITPDTTESRSFGILQTRKVDGDTITYHKHWWILLRKVFNFLMAESIIVFGTAFLVWRDLAGTTPGPISAFTAIVLAFLLSIVPVGLIIYHYLDWQNDIYRITKDTIIDSEKKPLGSEITKSAPIKNIQSIEHNREGLLRYILNFGDVKVSVADSVLDFKNVYDPAHVQQDIFYRKEQLEFEAELASAQAERARMAEWMKAYHEVVSEEPRKAKDQQDDGSSE